MSAVTSRPRITALALPHVTERPLQTMHASIDALSTIATICTTASATAGFTSVQVQQISERELRVVAMSESRHALVTEISVTHEGHASMATEVVGIHDGSCARILDTFDAAVVEAGIRSLPPKRTHTGGACELATAKDVLKRFTARLRPQPQSAPQNAGVSSVRKATTKHTTRIGGNQ